MINKTKTIHKGFSLVEVIVAIFIMTIGLVGVYTAIQSISNLAKDSNKRLQASFLALEGTEIIRNIRDNNYKLRDQNKTANWDANIRVQGPSSYYLFQVDYKSSGELTSMTLPSADGCGASLSDFKGVILSDQNNQTKIKCFNNLYQSSDLQNLSATTTANASSPSFFYDKTGSSSGLSAFKRFVLVSPVNITMNYSKVGEDSAMQVTSVVLWKFNDSVRFVVVDTLLFDWQDDIPNNI